MKKSKSLDLNKLSEAFIPNSVAYKKANITEAEKSLAIAKSIPRTTRRASPNECEFSRQLELLRNTKPTEIEERIDGHITAKEASLKLGISEFTIHTQRKNGILPYKKEKLKYYYDPEEIKKLDVRKYKKQNED